MKNGIVVLGMLVAAYVGHKVGKMEGYVQATVDATREIREFCSERRKTVQTRDDVPDCDFLFETREIAENRLAYLVSQITEYGEVSVEDLLRQMGFSTTYRDASYGWYSLGGAYVSKTRDGYSMNLPRPTKL